MDREHFLPVSTLIRRTAAAVGFAALCSVLAGCGGSQVDKYTVTEADRKAATGVIGEDGKPLPALPKDTHDSAAYGPDGKPMGGGAKAP